LLEIVKGGRPEDALTAAATALALEKGPVYGALTTYKALETFDKVKSNKLPTTREEFIASLEEILAKAEKQAQAKKNK
jgi:hypothetical protein